MRSWIGGLLLGTVAIGGAAFVMMRGGSASHCGPCLSGKCNTSQMDVHVEPPSDVIDLVDVARLPMIPEPGLLPTVSFDEPTLAAPAIRQVGFVEPAAMPPDRIPPAVEDDAF